MGLYYGSSHSSQVISPFGTSSLDLDQCSFLRPVAKRKTKPAIARPKHPRRSSDLMMHHNRDMAVAHAEEIERMTGDRCEVRRYGPSLYRIHRYDCGGKLVSNRSF